MTAAARLIFSVLLIALIAPAHAEDAEDYDVPGGEAYCRALPAYKAAWCIEDLAALRREQRRIDDVGLDMLAAGITDRWFMWAHTNVMRRTGDLYYEPRQWRKRYIAPLPVR